MCLVKNHSTKFSMRLQKRLNLGDFVFYFLFSLQEIPSDQTGWFSRTFVSGLLNPIPLKYFQCLQINGACSPKPHTKPLRILLFCGFFL